MEKGLTATHIKIIAVIAMICDHVAWAALDFFTPLAQIMHVLGRLTIPIMCFFVAEGFRHTSNIMKYMVRMIAFWIISIYPFHRFFGEMYGMRQNIIFDLFLGLFMLTVLENMHCRKAWKVIQCIATFIVSAWIGGWPIVPILFILIFYYCDSFKKKVLGITGVTVMLQISLILFAFLNQSYGLADVNWVWYEKLYLLGFVLALPVLRLYNGKLGSKNHFKYFFYVIYPLHFLILNVIFQVREIDLYQCYIYIHIMTMILMIILGGLALRSKPSQAQMANMLLVIFALIFMVGYYIELTTCNLYVIHAAIKVEYVGLTGILMAFTWFIDEFCGGKFSRWIYIIEGVITSAVLITIFTLENNTLYYRNTYMVDKGMHSVVAVEPGILYIVFYTYLAVVFLITELLCYKKIKSSEGIERKRSILIFAGTIAPVLFMTIKCLGISNGYDLLTLGILGFIFCFTIALIRYDYFDSLQTGAEIDPLTGVSNRGYFIERVQLQLSRRTRGSMFMMDMDNFKYLNDNFGHGAGDKVLTTFGETLKTVISAENFVCRLGGDEFCIFLVNKTKKRELKQIAVQIIKVFHENMLKEELMFKASASIGIAVYNGKKDETFEHLYENADKALYLAKNSGKSQYRFYE